MAGALEIGVAAYIDAALGGVYAAYLPHYRTLLKALDRAAGGDFAGLADRTAILDAFERDTLPGLPREEAQTSFDIVWRHVREGLFCDPVHGGNRNFAGWRAIGFPGAQFGYRAEEQRLDEA